MKRLLFFLLAGVVTTTATMGQRTISETYEVGSFKELDLEFEYPQLVIVKVWDQNTVKIEGTVDIQAGTYDEDFELRTSDHGDRFKISSRIKNMKRWRGNVIFHDDDEDEDVTTVSFGNGNTIVTGKNGRKTYRNGVYVDIEITVTIPKNMDVMIDARYGLVEVLESPNMLEVEARYGGVDVTIDESSLLELDARTQWGQIYTDRDLPVKADGNGRMGQWIRGHMALNRGNSRVKVESQYGNVYLRKN